MRWVSECMGSISGFGAALLGVGLGLALGFGVPQCQLRWIFDPIC